MTVASTDTAANTVAIADAYDPADSRRRVKAILLGSAGNLIEWYDVYVFAAFALYFSGSFFGNVSPEVRALNTSIVFALGFVARPIGSIVFGAMADKYGRRGALTASILLMCFGSLVIALTPPSTAIGIWAPIMLLVARLLQGLSQGGEYGASATYLSEMSHPDRRGFYSGVWYMTLLGGQLMALVTLLTIQSLLTKAELESWGWRIPFFIGAGLAIYTYFMRRDMHETEHFKAAKEHVKERAPFAELMKHWKSLLIVVGITAGGTSAFYTYTTYMQKFLKLTVKLPDAQVTMVTLGSLIVAVLMQPIYGMISDRVGRKPLLVYFGIMGTLCTYPLLTTLETTKDPWIAFLIIAAAWMIVSGYTSITAVIKAELFPTAVRAMGVGIPYAIAVAVFGGTMETVALTFKTQGWERGFYLYATGLIFISLLFYLALPDTKKHSKMDRVV